MSDKPRVYQGVRVKTTVKELLQLHRAREADIKKVQTISQSCVDVQTLCASPYQTSYIEAASVGLHSGADNFNSPRGLQEPPVAAFQAGGACGAQMLQESAFDKACFMDSIVPPAENYYDLGSGNCCTTLNPPCSFALPWSQHLSSDADYCNTIIASPSPSESLKLPSSGDHNSYSPQESFSSSSSSCYDSPTRMESFHNHGIPSEHFHYSHCNPHDCYCASQCWSGQQDSVIGQEYAPYYGPTDYPHTYPVEEYYLKRDLLLTSEMCYNVL